MLTIQGGTQGLDYMDKVTKKAVMRLSADNPGHSITMTHQFLDGYSGNACGFVPNDSNGEAIMVRGQWWKSNNTDCPHKGEINDRRR